MNFNFFFLQMQSTLRRMHRRALKVTVLPFRVLRQPLEKIEKFEEGAHRLHAGGEVMLCATWRSASKFSILY